MSRARQGWGGKLWGERTDHGLATSAGALVRGPGVGAAQADEAEHGAAYARDRARSQQAPDHGATRRSGGRPAGGGGAPGDLRPTRRLSSHGLAPPAVDAAGDGGVRPQSHLATGRVGQRGGAGPAGGRGAVDATTGGLGTSRPPAPAHLAARPVSGRVAGRAAPDGRALARPYD